MPEYYISKAMRSSNKKCAACNNKVAIIYDSSRKQLICKACSMQRRITEIGGALMDLPVLYRKEHLCEKCEHNKCRYRILKRSGPYELKWSNPREYIWSFEEVLICNECLSNYLGYN